MEAAQDMAMNPNHTVIDDCVTIPALFRKRVAELGAGKVALREKDLGIWNEYTWADYGEQARLGGDGIARPRSRSRRHLFRRRRDGQGVAVRGPRHHLRGRRHQRRLSDRFVFAGRIPHQRQRYPFLLRRRRGTTRQGTGCPGTHSDAREGHHLRHGRPARSGRSHVHVVRGTENASARTTTRNTPTPGTGRSTAPRPTT